MRFLLRTPASIGLLALLWTVSTTHAQECFPAPDGMVAWWPGDGNSDDIQGSNPGSLLGGVVFEPGKVLEAFSLDGVDDFIEVANTTQLNLPAFSVDTWIFFDPATSAGTANMIAIKGDGSSAGGGFFFTHDDRQIPTGFGVLSPSQGLAATTNGLRLEVFAGAGLITSSYITQAFPSAGYYHVAGTFDGSVARVYLNGSPGVSVSSISGVAFNTHNLAIGASLFSNNFFEGLIDEVELFNRALTQAELQAIFDAGTAGKCKDEDGDGFRPPEDCDETDPTVNPDGVELPGNFIDENCNGDLGECDPCFAWRNHGEYIRCTSREAEALVDIGEITQEKADQLVSDAARSDIGKKGYSPPECQ